MKMLDSNQIHTLFSTIQVIQNFNNQLCEDLKQSNQIANVFNQYFQGFRLYSNYCADFPKSQSFFNDLFKSNTAFKNFCHQAKKNDKKGLFLSDYLIMPIQRICKLTLFYFISFLLYFNLFCHFYFLYLFCPLFLNFFIFYFLIYLFHFLFLF